MHRNIFSPRLESLSADSLSTFFRCGAQVLFALSVGLLPLWFLPGMVVSLGFVKTMLVVILIYGSLLLGCLSLLRSGQLSLYIPLPIVFFWLFTLGTLLSAYLSGDVHDGLFGNSLEVFTAGFTLLMAFVMTLSLLFVGARTALARVLLLLLVSTLGVYILTCVRIFLGPEILSFGVLSSSTQSVVGSLNDLALYAGLMLVITLVAIYKVPENNLVRWVAALGVVTSLFLLAVVNFAFVWLVIGLLSLMTFLYLIAKDTWLKTGDNLDRTVSRFSLSMVALICVTAGAFVVSGDYLGSRVATLTGISYLEVRPSFSATTEVLKSVYQENILSGIGTNRFEDAWRLYKSPVINETEFWGTNFTSGNSYAYTIAVTTGVLGGAFFLLFMGAFIYRGYRFYFGIKSDDEGWNTIGLIVFSAALYLWLMVFWYTPGPTIMLLAAFFTGLAVAVSYSQAGTVVKTVNVAQSRQYGFLLIASTLLIIIASTSAFIAANKLFFTQVELGKGLQAFAASSDVSTYDALLERVSVDNRGQDVYSAERSRLRLAELNRLVTLTEPTEEDQQLFERSLIEGIGLAEAAISLDPTNPFNYALLGSFYGLLNNSEFEGVAKRRADAFEKAESLDPTNPEYALLKAQIANRFGETELARQELSKALGLKRDYTDALFMLSQLDIQEGNATSAIATTRSIITLEPQNPGRRFQLGLLLLATNDLGGAKEAFKDAIALDQNYANARYMLALTYLDSNEPEAALFELKQVAETNQDNESLLELIAQIESGNYTNPGASATAPLFENNSVRSGAEDEVVSNELPDTTLVSPVNRVQEPADGASDYTSEAAGEVAE